MINDAILFKVQDGRGHHFVERHVSTGLSKIDCAGYLNRTCLLSIFVSMSNVTSAGSHYVQSVTATLHDVTARTPCRVLNLILFLSPVIKVLSRHACMGRTSTAKLEICPIRSCSPTPTTP